MKCRYCKQEILGVGYNPTPKMYYCNEDHYKMSLEKKKFSSAKTTQSNPSKLELTDYIQKIYIENGYDKRYIPWTMLMSQVKNILSEHETWSYETIQYILYYMYEVENLNLFDENSKGSILNLIPYYGFSAEKYYNNTVEIQKSIETYEIQSKVIKYKPIDNKRKYMPIDFE